MTCRWIVFVQIFHIFEQILTFLTLFLSRIDEGGYPFDSHREVALTDKHPMW